ncbi:MAG: hypothetical protein OXF78_00190 [Rhodospirillales bacterium]|nr:hypothetical protein [Rhodospirillales bacterium]
MNLSARFSSALAALPAAVRARLDGDSDIDWDSLTDRTTVFGIDRATRVPTRLPSAVETLTERLVADVGIAPADVVRGLHGSGIAGTWMTAVAIEPDGERYRLRIKRSGELLSGVHPSSLAGYAVLGMELATSVQHACEAWTQAGERAQATPEDSRDGLTQCAAKVLHRLRAFPEAGSRPPSTLALARSMEDEWNAQTLQTREALASWQVACPWYMHAPRVHYYAVESSYRLHAFDIAEARWLQALAEHAVSVVQSGAGDRWVEAVPDQSSPKRIPVGAGIATGPVSPQSSSAADSSGLAHDSNAGGDAVKANDDGAFRGATDAPVHSAREAWQAPDDPGLTQALKSGLAPDDEATGESSDERLALEAHPELEQRSASGTALEQSTPARIPGETTDVGTGLFFGNTMEVRSPQAEIDLLIQASQRVPAAVTRRLGEAYGDSVVELLARLQDSSGIQDLRDTLGMEPPGNAVPGWMEELAAKLLLDTGVRTHDGERTGPARLDPERRAEGYEVSDITSSASGVFRAIDVIEQVRLSLGFVSDTWSALTLLSDAGKEAEWTLHDAAVKQARLTEAERARLEAMQRIQHELRRIRQAKADGSSSRPSALEEAAMAASVLKSLQPSERADAGWPADVGLPDPSDPGDVTRVMAAAETLHRDVRAIADRLITVWVADGRADREAQGA